MAKGRITVLYSAYTLQWPAHSPSEVPPQVMGIWTSIQYMVPWIHMSQPPWNRISIGSAVFGQITMCPKHRRAYTHTNTHINTDHAICNICNNSRRCGPKKLAFCKKANITKIFIPLYSGGSHVMCITASSTWQNTKFCRKLYI